MMMMMMIPGLGCRGGDLVVKGESSPVLSRGVMSPPAEGGDTSGRDEAEGSRWIATGMTEGMDDDGVLILASIEPSNMNKHLQINALHARKYKNKSKKANELITCELTQ